MKVLVCGGRDYNNMPYLFKQLDSLHKSITITQIIEGGARGADYLAGAWAIARGVPYIEFMADWDTHGKSAGIKRNIQMLHEGKPDLVVAFPGSRGTAHMAAISEQAGVKVIRVKDEQVP